MKLLVPLLCALAALVASCGSDEGGVSPDEAAGALSEQLMLPEAQRDCLRARFEESERAREALEAEQPAGDAGLEALGQVVLDCVPADTLAPNLASLMASAYATATEVDADDRDCLEQRISALPRERQVLLVTGPVARSAQVDSEASLAVGALIDEIVTACGIGAAPPTTTTMDEPAIDEESLDEGSPGGP